MSHCSCRGPRAWRRSLSRVPVSPRVDTRNDPTASRGSRLLHPCSQLRIARKHSSGMRCSRGDRNESVEADPSFDKPPPTTDPVTCARTLASIVRAFLDGHPRGHISALTPLVDESPITHHSVYSPACCFLLSPSRTSQTEVNVRVLVASLGQDVEI